MAEQSDRSMLQREFEKHQAAASGVSEKIAVIDKEERRKREALEEKERELASLRSQLETCARWISRTEKKIGEAEEAAVRQVEAVCSGQGEVALLLGQTLRDLATWELELVAFKAYAASLQVKIKGH